MTISVGTQTEPGDDRHKRLRRKGTADKENIETSRWVQGLRISEHDVESENRHILGDILENMSDIVEPNLDQSSNYEVGEAISRGCTSLQEAMRYRQRTEIHFHSASDVMSLTSEIETFDEGCTDTDDSEDDESVNIYEEALNYEDYGYKSNITNRFTRNEYTNFHQVRK